LKGLLIFKNDNNTFKRYLWNRLVHNAAKKLPKDVIAGFYTVEAKNPKTGEKIGFDIGIS
jgi:hypothetical protein